MMRILLLSVLLGALVQESSAACDTSSMISALQGKLNPQPVTIKIGGFPPPLDGVNLKGEATIDSTNAGVVKIVVNITDDPKVQGLAAPLVAVKGYLNINLTAALSDEKRCGCFNLAVEATADHLTLTAAGLNVGPIDVKQQKLVLISENKQQVIAFLTNTLTAADLACKVIN